jgi:starch synthase (maltosyl-transferring)
LEIVALPPIHPIGVTHRKGPNNSRTPGKDDPGSPWAIGSKAGGHTAVNPDLGTLGDFDAFTAAAKAAGLEVALDYALQCSPDHPWVAEHPDWFRHRPDGTIRYAENPPKRYQDIYPINFDTDDRVALWDALREVMLFWISHGVRVFRVDNPHTKPIAFWEWLITGIRERYPEVIFLAEAFTRPAVMKRLAKIGFTQSYTYFTWRNTKYELTQYLTELSSTEMVDYFRPNFWVNTPDILHPRRAGVGIAGTSCTIAPRCARAARNTSTPRSTRCAVVTGTTPARWRRWWPSSTASAAAILRRSRCCARCGCTTSTPSTCSASRG